MHPTAEFFQAMFAPRCIALVGASADLSKNNARPQRFLRAHGYTGRILPINPGRAEILGERAYPDLRSAPGPIDHVFIMVPAAAVPEVIDQCCELKCRSQRYSARASRKPARTIRKCNAPSSPRRALQGCA
jgi:acyl-CoA synthetase (NDP forming)